jgi:L-ascorbate metabolism protein UlaG (beta-lactamase superfamily)
MDITFLGHSAFRLRGKTATLVTDPYDASVGFKPPKVSADIVTVSHDHHDHNRADHISDIKRVVNGPGEYEISGVSIIGISTFHDDKNGQLRGKNTVYVIEIDNLRIVHLGDLGHKLNEKIQEEIGSVDVLMIPVGGVYTIGPSEASEVVRAVEPNIILPMHYQIKGLDKKTFGKLAKVDQFLSELGLPSEKMSKLAVKKSDLDSEQKVVVLERR